MTPKNSSVFSTRRSLLVAGAVTLATPLVLRAQSPAKVIRIGSPDLGTAGKPSPGGSVFAVLQANKWLEDEFAKDGIKIEWNFFRGTGSDDRRTYAPVKTQRPKHGLKTKTHPADNRMLKL